MSKRTHETIPSPALRSASKVTVLKFKFIKAKQISVNIDIYDWWCDRRGLRFCAGFCCSASNSSLWAFISFLPPRPSRNLSIIFFPLCYAKKREVKNHIKRISLFVLMRLLEWHRSVWDCFTSSPAREPVCRGEWFRSNQADDELISDFFRAIAVNAGEYIAGIFNFPLRVKLHFEA